MKLAIITNILAPYRLPLFSALRARVERQTVLLMAQREENRQWLLDTPDFDHEVLPGIHFKLPGAAVSLHVNHGVFSALRQFDPDVVLSGGFAPANLAAALFCRLHDRSFVGWGELTMQDAVGRSWLRRGLRHLVLAGADGAIASSSAARMAFLALGLAADRVETVLMPVDVEFYAARVQAYRSSPEFGAERARYPGPILLSIGQLIERKGIRELLAIYAKVLETAPDTSLLIVGDGPMRSDYERSVREQGWERVHFPGYCQPEGLIRHLALADVFIFPTLHDPFGAVLSEAMAAGLPVVSSVHAAATHDLVTEGVTGFRIDPHDPVGSARPIDRLLAMAPGEREQYGLRAYARVRQCGVEATADAMCAFLQSMLEKRRRGAAVARATP